MSSSSQKKRLLKLFSPRRDYTKIFVAYCWEPKIKDVYFHSGHKFRKYAKPSDGFYVRPNSKFRTSGNTRSNHSGIAQTRPITPMTSLWRNSVLKSLSQGSRDLTEFREEPNKIGQQTSSQDLTETTVIYADILSGITDSHLRNWYFT